MLALFRLSLPADAPVLAPARGKPIYLILAMSGDKLLRMKPQNLVAGLPLATRELAN